MELRQGVADEAAGIDAREPFPAWGESLAIPVAGEAADDGGGLAAVDLELADESVMLLRVGEAAIAADVQGQLAAKMIAEEALREAGEELVSQGTEATIGREVLGCLTHLV